MIVFFFLFHLRGELNILIKYRNLFKSSFNVRACACGWVYVHVWVNQKKKKETKRKNLIEVCVCVLNWHLKCRGFKSSEEIKKRIAFITRLGCLKRHIPEKDLVNNLKEKNLTTQLPRIFCLFNLPILSHTLLAL
jgi:hypothetical protein